MAEKLAYTVPEACEVVGIGRSRMYDLLREGADQGRSAKATGA